MYVWFIMTWEGCFRSFDKDTRTLTLSLSLGKADRFDFIVICCLLPYYTLHCTIPTHIHTHTIVFFYSHSISIFQCLFFPPSSFQRCCCWFRLLLSGSSIWFHFSVYLLKRVTERERVIKSALVGCERVSIVTEPFLVL